MSSRFRGIFAGFVWLLLPALVWGALGLSAPHISRWDPAAPQTCQPQSGSQWITNGQTRPLQDDRAVMASNGMVVLQVCRPGVLTFTASGTAAQKLWPLMSVSVNAQPLLTARVSTDRSYHVQVPEAGFLSITFHDDAYLPDANPPEDRNLFVSAVRFVAVP